MAVAPLQDPRVGALLGMSREELLREMRLLLSAAGNLAARMRRWHWRAKFGGPGRWCGLADCREGWGR